MEKGERRTRWQAAPDWTAWECLTLVNEISAVEGEWRNSLSSFQKWQLVAENCCALDINRSLNQCKKKWDALRAEYEKIKRCHGDYWSFGSNKRKDLGLPEEFDEELFQAMKKYFKQKGDGVATPDTDPEAQAKTKKLFLHTGPKKQRKRRVPRKTSLGERLHPWRHILSGLGKPEPSSLNEIPQAPPPMASQVVKAEPSTLNEIPEHPPASIVQEVKPEPWIEEDAEKMMNAKLLENAQLINSILQGNLAEEVDCQLADSKDDDAVDTDLVRCQGDKIIHCLGNIVNTLNQYCNVLQERNAHNQVGS